MSKFQHCHSLCNVCTVKGAALAIAAIAVIFGAVSSPSSMADAPTMAMTDQEQCHVLSAFLESAPNGNSSKDTVWAHRVYAPMHIHRPALTSYHAAIQKAFPEHAITFDVIFAAADNAVPWHCDFDSLGPFEASLGSIGQDDFITVHANLITAKESGGGQLRTLDSLMLAAVHFIANRLTGAFGSLGDQTEWLSEILGLAVQTRAGDVGVGHPFNNLKAHSVTAGTGRVSYVVRLVRRDVLMSREKVKAIASGTGSSRGSRRLVEFDRITPLMTRNHMRVGQFPWGRVGLAAAEKLTA